MHTAERSGARRPGHGPASWRAGLGSLRVRLGFWGLLLGAALGVLGTQLGVFEAAAALYYRARPRAPSVVLVVLDTVRADRLSLCGYARPTTPTLEDLAGRGAAWTCDAVAPGSWTLPSHASFFTGVDVPEHGVHFADAGVDIRGLTIRPLPGTFSTLAEQMAAAGYQTVGVSANPVLSRVSGLAQGFDSWRVAAKFDAWYGPLLVRQVRQALRELDRDGPPLFLFVNIVDAHDPWPPIPPGLDWLPPRTEGLGYFLGPGPGPWARYVTGEMDAAEREAFRTRLGDLYDFGVHRADRSLADVLEEIERHGWASAGMRLVVVSDHGEFLGEHGLARHGRYVWEANHRIPLLVLDTQRRIDLPSPLSALHVFSLVRDGALPDTLVPPHAVAYPDSLWLNRSGGRIGGSTSAALWSGSQKFVWKDGERARYDLGRDPGELEPQGLGDHPLVSVLDALVERVLASKGRDGDTGSELAEALRALGYAE
jgi:hypothetical protein